MFGAGITRKAVATAITAFVCGGAAIAAAATLPADTSGPTAFGAPTSSSSSTTVSSTESTTTTTTTPEGGGTATSPTSTTSTTSTTTTTAPGTTPAPCNHGKEVSEVAHNTPPGPGHGEAVREIARHGCNHHDEGDVEGDGNGADAPDAGEDGPPPSLVPNSGDHGHGHDGHGHGGGSDSGDSGDSQD